MRFLQFGARTEFAGQIRLCAASRDNARWKSVLSEQGGQVLVIDGDASLHTALVGDVIARTRQLNGWWIDPSWRCSRCLERRGLGSSGAGHNPRKARKRCR